MDLFHYIQLNYPPYILDLLRLIIWLILLVVIFTPLEYFWSVHQQKFFRKNFSIELGYYFLNGLLPKFLLVVPVSLITIALSKIIPIQVKDWGAGLSFPARATMMMVVGEIGYYWGHRLMHQIPWLWRFHAIHHSAEEMGWLVNTRAHPLDMVIPRLLGFSLMYACGLVQVNAGQNLDIVALIVMFIGILWGFFIHANLRWRFGWLEWLIATPYFHHWHHTNDNKDVINKNYASMLPWIDWLFGSLYLPKKQWPKVYGIDKPLANRLLLQIIQPFYK